MAISTDKLLKLSQFQTGLQAAKNYTDKQVAAEQTRAKAAETDAKKAGTDAQKTADDVKTLVGALPKGATATDVIGYVEEKTAGIATDAALQQLQGRVTANKNAIDTLNGTGAGSVKKSVDDAINDFATKVSDDKVVNTFKELVDYVAEHGAEAATMAGKIEANETAIAKNAEDITKKADKATTLAGYGITDAYTKTAADAKTKEIIASEVVINVATDEEITAVCTTVFGAA